MRKAGLILPFIFMPVFTPIYVMLDKLFFVEIFGCGCVPWTQTNMFNIDLNANDLRVTVFAVLTVVLALAGAWFANAFRSRAARVLYCLAVFFFNAALALFVCERFMWA